VLLDRETQTIMCSTGDLDEAPAEPRLPADLSVWINEGVPSNTNVDDDAKPPVVEVRPKIIRPLSKKGFYYVSPDRAVPARVKVPRRRPHSARHVVTLAWSWSPMHSRVDKFFLSLDSARKYWLLWYEARDEGYSVSRVCAFMLRKRYSDAKDAAAALLECYYLGEEEEFESPGNFGEVWQAGVLSNEELDAMARHIWGLERAMLPVQEGPREQ
jgi:hypothetical protein